jgi:5'-nucleotidase
MQTSAASIPWQDIDTVLLDMDGTLLDLAFDNYFWLELVPARYAELNGLAAEEAQRRIALRYQSVIGSLDWYCVDYWSRELDLDIAALKWGHRHLISYLPGARSFLFALRKRGKPFSIVTNAHPATIRVKTAETRLNTLVDGVVCSHELRAPKESAEFWKALQRRHPFDPKRTLLIEDSLPVLTAARQYGLCHTVAIRQPDSRLPARSIEEFPSVLGVGDLLPR